MQPGIPAIITVHRHERYVLTLRICADGHSDVVRVEARLEDRRRGSERLRGSNPLAIYPLLAPHLGFSGLHNRAWIGMYKGRRLLFAQNDGSNLALASDPAPTRQSVGYVGVSDGWQDFVANDRMAWTHASTGAGNVAGMLEVVPDSEPIQIALAFGAQPEEAALQATAALAGHFDVAWNEYAAD